MPSRRRRKVELERVLGTPALFATAYGNVGSSIYYALGVTLKQQARYHGLATYLAWKQTDISMFAQFLLQDIAPPPGAEDDPVEASRDWHSGLYFSDGRPKEPGIQAFKLPFWAETRTLAGSDVVVQVRPSEGRKRIEVEMRGADGTWIPIQTYETRPAGDVTCGTETTSFLTDSEGFFQRLAPYQGPTYYRARWIKTDGTSEYGVSVPVYAPEPPPTG